MKNLRPKLKVLLGWTFFFYLILLIFVVRYQVTRNQQRRWTAPPPPAEKLDTQSPPPSQPDTTVKEIPPREVESLLLGTAEQWSRESPEKREAALLVRVKEFQALDPQAAEGVVNHLLKNHAEAPVEKRVVDITELHMDTIVPINMRSGTDAKGQLGVWVEIQDDIGQVAEYWVAEEDLSPEEKQALKAFTMMREVPGLDKLRPLLTPLLRQAAQP